MLNGSASALLALGTILGALTGAIGFLFKQLVDTKNAQIRELTRDRDYWQSTALGLLGSTDRAIRLAEGRQSDVDNPRRYR